MKKIILTFLLLAATQQATAQKDLRLDDSGLVLKAFSQEDFFAAERKAAYESYGVIEAESLRISLGVNLKGFVEGKVCDACKKIRLIITPATKAYANGILQPLKNAKTRLGKQATVFFETKTKRVTSISWL